MLMPASGVPRAAGRRLCIAFTGMALAIIAGVGRPACGQDAAPQDRSAVNAPTGPSGMAADSPVVFPASGPLPPTHPPDVPQPAQPTEEGVYVFESLPLVPPEPEIPLAKYAGRSAEQIAAISSTLPPGRFTPPPHDWRHLAKTRHALTTGGTLTIVALGDSIVNDTMRSGWISGLRRQYPQATIRSFVCVRGGGGCHFFCQEDRIARYVLPLEPDLVIIGGISRGDRTLPDGSVERAGIGPIRDVIGQIRAARPDTEILLMTGAFGAADPRSDAELAAASHSATSPEGKALRALADETSCGFLDMTTPWSEYIRSSGLHPHRFYRDRVHANEHGEQILARILLAFFSIDDQRIQRTPLVIREGGTAENPSVFDGEGLVVDLGIDVTSAPWERNGDLWTLPAPADRSLPIIAGQSAALFVDDMPITVPRDLEAEARQPDRRSRCYLPPERLAPGQAGFTDSGGLVFRWPAEKNPATSRLILPPAAGVSAVTIACSHVIVRNVTARYAANDGFNIHGGHVGIVLENVRAISNGDEGISAHGDVQLMVRRAEVAWNGSAAGGVADVGRSITSYEDCLLHDNTGAAFFFSGKRHAVTRCRIFHQSQSVASAKGTDVSITDLVWDK